MKKLFLCEDCDYFIQHYGFDSNGSFKVYCGHCVKRILRFSAMSKLTTCPKYKHSEKIGYNLLKEMLFKLEKNLTQINNFIDSKKD